MKSPLPVQLFILCSFALSILWSFQIGVSYAAKPYRAWFANSASRVEFTQIGVQQSHTQLLVSYSAVGLSLLGLGFLLFHLFRKKKPIHLPVPTRGSGA